MKLNKLIENLEVEDIPSLIREIREEVPKIVENAAYSHAFFKAKVGESGRVTIPTAEREVLEIEEGDIVQVIVKPLNKNEDSEH
ncbi:MAG: AbrB/MazE/SpoVT family DNA-binding domain-containing protein [Candidatus Woesearchaeota archaeon]